MCVTVVAVRVLFSFHYYEVYIYLPEAVGDPADFRSIRFSHLKVFCKLFAIELSIK